MKNGMAASVIFVLAVLFAGCASSGNSDGPKAKSPDDKKNQFEVEIQSGGSGTTLSTDELNDFSYQDENGRE